jgi:hypothetical protein
MKKQKRLPIFNIINYIGKNKKLLFTIQACLLILISGSFGGLLVYTDIYDDVQGGIVEVLCLSCIKLEPITSRDFTFETANEADHPNFVKNTLKNKNFILIQYGTESCPACDDMIQFLIEPYFNISFYSEKTKYHEYEIELENFSFQYIYIYIKDKGTAEEKTSSWEIYDKDNIGGFPMFTFITLEYEHSGKILPYYTTIYGKLNMGDDYSGIYKIFYELLEESQEKYERNIAGYK